jgi:hypothetical protein
VPTTDSRKVLAAVFDDTPVASAPAAPGMRNWSPVFIIASPRARTGKTFLARLVTDFLHKDGGEVEAFDLDPAEGSLADYRPDMTTKADLGSTPAQVALIDRLVVCDGVARIVDLDHASYKQFFTLVEELGFMEEACRRGLEVIILFAADAHPGSAQAYGKLQRRFPGALLVAVFNEAILKGRKVRDQYPFGRAAAVPLQVPFLPPALKAHVDTSTYSFADLHAQLPIAIPIGHAFELRSWTKRAFLEFREFELRLLLEKLRASLGQS